MKTIAPERLESGTLCYCWKLVLADRSYGFTDHDKNLTFDSLTYEASSGFTSSTIESGLGLKIDNLEVSGALSSEILTEEEINKGKFDGAEIFIYRVNWKNPDAHNVLLKRGNIGEITRTTYGFSAELRGLAHKLSYPQGRVYQKNCDADLGDSRCKKNIQTYTRIVNVESVGEDNHLMNVNNFPSYADNYFAAGKLTFLSGANQDITIEIRQHYKEGTKSSFLLLRAPPYSIQVGDRIQVVAGCDKTLTTCQNKFQNQLNFRGFPHLPGNDYVQYYPRD
jgi:uncharacterized phage protein (TIGR02218 family)